MPSMLNSLLAFIAAIALLVAIHEFGHYSVARLFGVKVLRYSIGFGQVLWSRRAGADQTEYCLSAIPLGGYVKLLDERDCAVSFAERGRAFNRQSGAVRMAILFAGPAFNLVFAVLAYTLMFMHGVPGIKPVVGTVEPGSIAANAGLREGDTIVSVGGQHVLTWESATLGILDELLANGTIRLDVSAGSAAGSGSRQLLLQAAGHESELTEPGRLFAGLGFKPWAPVPDAVIGELVADGPAERAGLKSGDRVLAVDGIAVDNWADWVELVRARPGQLADVRLSRGGEELDLPVEIEAVDSDAGRIGRIGAAVLLSPGQFDNMRAEERLAPVEALQRATVRTWEMSVLTLRMIWRMLVGDVSVKNISGPINIAQYAGYSASIGLSAFLSFLAVVSISLGVLNLLPVPMLDGGQIVYTLAEQLKGSPLSERAQMIGQQVGLGLLLLLMSFAFYNDISRLLG
ncbi:MAG: RIP metalloprotease RseP [Gammaproteobacteria bacterium]|nr:RIP metalloprotease RseP [Gammaproteobacteria bacterium]